MKRAHGLLALLIFLALVRVSPPALAQKKADVLQRANAAGVSVGGLTPHQARQRLAHVLSSKLNVSVVLTDGAKTCFPKTARLGHED